MIGERVVGEGEPAGMPLPPVQMFWFGRPLDEIERLGIASFLHHGHDVHLYSYGPVKGAPSGATLLDAGTVVPAEQFERLQGQRVPLAIFADYFRAVLLRDHGGWWVDIDVVCLKPFDFASEYVFGWQDQRVIANGVMRVPRGAEVAQRLVRVCQHPTRWMQGDSPRRLASKTRDAVLGRRTLQTVRWGATGPAALTGVVFGQRLVHHAMATEVFYPVHWEAYERLFTPGPLSVHGATFGIHVWNGMRGTRKPEPGSPIRLWMDHYGI